MEYVGLIDGNFSEIMLSSANARKEFGFPIPTQKDWEIITSLRSSSALLPDSDYSFNLDSSLIANATVCLHKIKEISFYPVVKSFLLNKASEFASKGVMNYIFNFRTEMVFRKQEPAEYWFIRSLMNDLYRSSSIGMKFGIMMNNSSWAMDIALRNDFDFVFVKTANDFISSSEIRNRKCDGTSRKIPNVILEYKEVSDSFELICYDGIMIHYPSLYVRIPEKNFIVFGNNFSGEGYNFDFNVINDLSLLSK